jgi:antitoxin FitA
MAHTLLLRDLDDALIARLEERARRNSRSLEAEIKAILEQAVDEPAPPRATRQEALTIVDKWQRSWKEQSKTFSDSAELIRRDRDR